MRENRRCTPQSRAAFGQADFMGKLAVEGADFFEVHVLRAVLTRRIWKKEANALLGVDLDPGLCLKYTVLWRSPDLF